MQKVFLSLSVIAAIMAFTGCSKNNPGPSNTASVMFVDGCSGTTTIDAKVNSVKVVNATSIQFLKNSGYQNITSGSLITIGYSLTSQGTPLCSTSSNLTTGSHYSLFAGGIITNPSIVLTVDDLTTPTTGNAKVRFINLSSDSLNESFFVGNVKLDSNVAYGAYGAYHEVTAASGAAVLVQDPLKPTKIAQISSQAFNVGKIYTIMITGNSAGTGTSALSLSVINNN